MLAQNHIDKPLHGVFYKHLRTNLQFLRFEWIQIRDWGNRYDMPRRCLQHIGVSCWWHGFGRAGYKMQSMSPITGDNRTSFISIQCLLWNWWNACVVLCVQGYKVRGQESTVQSYSISTLKLLQANTPDVSLVGHQKKTMFVIESSVQYAERTHLLLKTHENWTQQLLTPRSGEQLLESEYNTVVRRPENMLPTIINNMIYSFLLRILQYFSQTSQRVYSFYCLQI